MLKKRKNLPAYTDGVARFYREKDNFTSFKAKQNAISYDDLEFVNCCVYANESIRERDMDFAYQQGKTLSKKIRCPKVTDVDTECKVTLADHLLYDIANIDESDRELFIYLEGGRIVNG